MGTQIKDRAMFKEKDVPIEEVYNYWNTNTLYSYEISETPGSREFYEQIDTLRRNDIEKFNLHFWQFDQYEGKKVLDIGCGPGWMVRNYASNGADVHAIDIADNAVALTNKMLEVLDLKANVQVANAEELPFEDNTFDFVSSNGVLHHAPRMQQAINEAYRVLKPGHEAVISIYYKNILFHPVIFPVTMAMFRALKPKVPGRDKINYAKDADDFIRMYDGNDTPIGYGLTLKECKQVFSKFEILEHEVHFFPKRFLPIFKNSPEFFHRIFDKYFGTMIYFRLRKNAD